MSVFDKYRDGGASIFDKYRKKERGILGEAKAWITGEDKEPNIPVLGQDFPLDKIQTSDANKARLAALIASTPDDDKLAKGFKLYIPDAEVSKDQFGNLTVVAPVTRDEQGKPLSFERFYPNPKGLADIPTAYQAAGAITLAQPVAKAIGGTGYKAAAATGASEAGILEAITSTLTDTAYRLSEPAGGGAAGIAFKGAFDSLRPVVGKIAEVLKIGGRSNPEKIAQVKSILAENGFDPDLIMDQTFKKIMSDVGAGANPTEAARLRTAESLPTPVPMSRFDVTDDKNVQLTEEALRSGMFGTDAAQRVTARDLEQQQAIGENLQQIQQSMAGEGQIIAPRAGAQSAQQALVEQRRTAKDAYTEAYDKAKSSQAFIDPEAGDQVAADIFNSVFKETSEVSAPKTLEIWRNEVEPLLQQGQSLTDIFAARSKLSTQSAEMTPDGFAAGRMAKELDNKLMQMADDVMLHGDPDAVKNWLDAISKFKDFKQKWDTNGVLKKLTTTGMRDGDVVLNVAPEEAANAIFGAALNPNKTNLARDLIKMRDNLPAGEWDGLRQEFFLKLSDRMFTPAGDIKGSTFASSWAEVKKNKTLLNTLFSKEEQQMIDALSTTALRIGGKARNYSNTANTVFAMMGRIANTLGKMPVSQAVGNFGVKQAYGAAALAQPTLSKDSFLSRVGSGAVGGTMGGESQEDFNRWLFGE